MSYLDQLTSAALGRSEALVAARSIEALEANALAARPPRGFAAALDEGATKIVAEIKRATPRGVVDADLDPKALADAYLRGGAAAISVLTEPEWFLGSLEDLDAAAGTGLPVLRKDFIVSAAQVLESRAAGADAILLIVRILGDELASLLDAAQTLGMDALVEVHDRGDIERAAAVGASLIGINHRDLVTFDVDPERTMKLAPLAPPDSTLVSLSGVSSRAEVKRLARAGASAVLVGTSLIQASDPAAKLAELVGA